MNLIGIVGYPGAGKDVLGELIFASLDAKGKKASVLGGGELIRSYMIEHKLGDPGDRSVTQKVSSERRKALGSDYLMTMLIEYAKNHHLDWLVIPGLRHAAEVDFLRQHEGILIAIDVPARVRYERVQARARHGNQISFETFLAQEAAESSGESHHVGEVMALADATVVNDGTLDQLKSVAKRIMVDLAFGKLRAHKRPYPQYVSSRF